MADIESIYRELEILGIQDVDRRLTSDVVQKYGFFPYSVWRVQNDSTLTALVEDDIAEGTYGADKSLIDKVSSKKKGYANKLSGKGLSKFNPAVAYRIIKYWSKPGDVVLDSFSNRGVIALIAGHLGRKGRIYEIVPSYHAHVDKLFKRLEKSSKKGLFQSVKYDLKAYLGDARECKYTEDNSVDLWCSSPPFYNLERYESVDGQLSDIETYSDFLKSYYKAMKQIYRVLKPGKFAIFVVNDFRRPRAPGEKSELILFSDDTKRLMKKAGFEMWDIVVNFLYSTPSVIGINKCAEMHRTLKSHEYILVFKKPEE